MLALFYAFASALPKLIAHPSAVESFDEAGLGQRGDVHHRRARTGGCHRAVDPALASVGGGVALSALMVGAFIAQVTAFDGEYAATPLILIVPLALIAWARRQDVAGPAQWVRRVRREA